MILDETLFGNQKIPHQIGPKFKIGLLLTDFPGRNN